MAFEGGRKFSSELWGLYRFEFAIVGGILLPAALGPSAFLALLLAISLRGVFEIFDLFGKADARSMRAMAMIGGALLVITGYGAPESLLPALVIAVALYLVLGTALERGHVSLGIIAALVSLFFPCLLIAFVAALRDGHNGFGWILLVYGIVEMNDAFALLVGRLVGRHNLLPRLSPRKTAEGLIGGAIVGFATGLAIAHYYLGLDISTAAPLAAAILAAGIAGDLICSALKRWFGRKDFRPLVAAHGGILDIYDSLLVAAPFALLVRVAAGL